MDSHDYEEDLKDHAAQEEEVDKEYELTRDEQEERKKLFFKTIKTKNWTSIVANVVIGVVFAGYFIQMYVLNNYYENQMLALPSSMPTFFDRYRDIMLTYSFLRERVINNNSLDTYEADKDYGHNLDQMYRDFQTSVENDIRNMKNSYTSIIAPLVDLAKVIDSQEFCTQIIGGIAG